MYANLLDEMLSEQCLKDPGIGITLKDGTALYGKIKDFDSYVIILDGNPETVIYRHSILKLSASVPKPAAAREPAPVRAAPPVRETAPVRERTPRRPQQRPANRPDPRHAHESVPQDKTGQFNPMAEAMQKWLKSQKGGA